MQNFNNPEGIETDEEWNEIKPWLRPVLLNIVKSKKVLLEGVTFKNSPSWCLHPLSCEDITINNVKVFNHGTHKTVMHLIWNLAKTH